MISRCAPPRVDRRESVTCSSATSRATSIRIASISPATAVGRDDVVQRRDLGREAPLRRLVVARERDQQVDLQREAGGRGVQPRGDAADHARLLHPPHAVERRGGGEPDDPGQLHVGPVGVGLRAPSAVERRFRQVRRPYDETIFRRERPTGESIKSRNRLTPKMRWSCRFFAVIPLLWRSSPRASSGGSPCPCRSSSSSGSTAARSPSCASRSPRRCWRSLARKHLAAAFTPRILAAGAIGYGLVIVLQNAGIERTTRQPRRADRRRHAGARRARLAVATGRGSLGPARLDRLRARARGRGDRRRRRRGSAPASAATRSCCCRSRSAPPSSSSSRRCCAGRDPFAVTAVQMIGGAARRAAQRARSRASRTRPRARRP